ncbi:MAG: transglycosylase family protein [Microthrixaceae bacterium]
MSGSNPPSTNGSPRRARRAIARGLATLGALLTPVGLIASTAGGSVTGLAAAALVATNPVVQVQAAPAAPTPSNVSVEFQSHEPPASITAPPARMVAAAVGAPVVAPPVPPAPPAPPRAGDPNDPATWDRLARCESDGRWSINTGNGYYGGLQFSLSSWRSVGGTGYPHNASRDEQIERAKRLYASGGWRHWPACTRRFGWR